MKNRTMFFVVLYLQVAFFTGAYRWNNVNDNHFAREVGDTMCGMFWPVYWNVRFYAWATK